MSKNALSTYLKHVIREAKVPAKYRKFFLPYTFHVEQHPFAVAYQGADTKVLSGRIFSLMALRLY